MRKELFYTEGTAALKQARLQIAHFSLDRAATRLAGAKRKRESPDEDEEAEQKDTIALMSTVNSLAALNWIAENISNKLLVVLHSRLNSRSKR